ncbi:T9SS type A sorting domain-containing protein, partial [candidate division KSB1 bacterium]
DIDGNILDELEESKRDWFYENFVLRGSNYDQWDVKLKNAYPDADVLNEYSTVILTGGNSGNSMGEKIGYKYDYYLTGYFQDPMTISDPDVINDLKEIRQLTDWLDTGGRLWVIDNRIIEEFDFNRNEPGHTYSVVIIDSTSSPPQTTRIPGFFEKYFYIKPSIEFYKVIKQDNVYTYQKTIYTPGELYSKNILSYNESKFSQIYFDTARAVEKSIPGINYLQLIPGSEPLYYMDIQVGRHDYTKKICSALCPQDFPRRILTTFPLYPFRCNDVRQMTLKILTEQFGEIFDDNPAPASPYDLKIISWDNSSTRLLWKTNEMLEGFNIYRRTSEDTVFVKINTNLLTEPCFEDKFITDGTKYYYAVTNVDYLSIESDFSIQVTDIAGRPHKATGFVLEPSDSKIKVYWNSSKDTDVLGYNLYKKLTSDKNFMKVNPSLITDTLYIDSDVINYTNYTYYVTVADSFSESYPSTVKTDFPKVSGRNILVINEIDYDACPGEFEQSYGSKVFTGGYDYDVWNISEKTLIENFPEDVEVRGEGIFTFDVLREYNTIVWVDNIIENDDSHWENTLSTIIQCIKNDQNLLILSPFLGSFLTDSSFTHDVCGLPDIYFIYDHYIRELYPVVKGLQPIYSDGTYLNVIYSLPISTRVEPIFKFGEFSNYPAGFRSRLNHSQQWQIAAIVIRFTDFDMDALKANIEIILHRWFNLTVGIKEEEKNIPKGYILSQNYPNPFNNSTIIKYGIPEPGAVKLEIYNTLGQKVRTLLNSWKQAGYHSTIWDGRNDSGFIVSSGVYLYVINTNTFFEAKKMILLR